ncbi:uncharacterized protein DUF4440 [Roseimicrobium gellanilyticum]|uniref:Uncharacterized protein DUF4440 n=1 Tax=Roseimicrobium gellanilyticum TaxID=748857 RepID=A0A366HTT3_9BACT|nr:nuclear transport factor 2 family protein [Roseimicrobium gellanilyticum]RBP47250.1 uncharacterized protein DUF4440 [Roseimicrobium gellanilyticum]
MNTKLKTTADRVGKWTSPFVCMVVACLVLASCGGTNAGGKTPSGPHPDEANIRAFLNTYFSTWSAKDMDGYGACFHPQARILMLDADDKVSSQGLTDFLHGQKMAHQLSKEPMVEKPLEMRFQGDMRGVQAEVTWVLTKGSSEVRGTDLFTLKREGNGWKIVALVFYGE